MIGLYLINVPTSPENESIFLPPELELRALQVMLNHELPRISRFLKSKYLKQKVYVPTKLAKMKIYCLDIKHLLFQIQFHAINPRNKCHPLVVLHNRIIS